MKLNINIHHYYHNTKKQTELQNENKELKDLLTKNKIDSTKISSTIDRNKQDDITGKNLFE